MFNIISTQFIIFFINIYALVESFGHMYAADFPKISEKNAKRVLRAAPSWCTTTAHEGWCEKAVNWNYCAKVNEDGREQQCNPNPCPPGTTCYLSGPCKAHYSTGCDSSNPCLAFPCQRGGTCRNTGTNAYQCDCTPGYDGNNDCKTEINECQSNPCLHGTCTDRTNGYSCSCYAGYTGVNCQIEINECRSNPCLYGTCNDEINAYNCSCYAGYTGINCQIEINECQSNPCLHGTCTDEINAYNCSCFAGYTGINCQTDINECESSPCLHGQCVDGIDKFTCVCENVYAGSHCEQFIHNYFVPLYAGITMAVVTSSLCAILVYRKRKNEKDTTKRGLINFKDIHLGGAARKFNILSLSAQKTKSLSEKGNNSPVSVEEN